MLGFHPLILPQSLLSSLLTRLHVGIQVPRPWHADPLIRTSCRQLTRKTRLREDRAKVGCNLSCIPTALCSTPTSALEDGGDSLSTSDGNLALRPISPSSVAAFRQCKQLFYFRHILRLETPSTPEQVRGILVHDVLARFFDMPERSRDIESLHELFRTVFNEFKSREREDPRFGYADFFEGDEELQWAVGCLDLLANFLKYEREMSALGSGPHESQSKRWWQDPERREFKMSHMFGKKLGGCDPSRERSTPAMSVTGIVDRLDRCADGKLRVVDYKTGKVPRLKYNEATNSRIMNENFFQLKGTSALPWVSMMRACTPQGDPFSRHRVMVSRASVVYALLVERLLGEVPGEMRIIYLSGPASVTRDVKRDELVGVERELRGVWDDIARAVAENQFPTTTGRLCEWCTFKDRCPAFVDVVNHPCLPSDSDSDSDSESESGRTGGRGKGSRSRGKLPATRKRR